MATASLSSAATASFNDEYNLQHGEGEGSSCSSRSTMTMTLRQGACAWCNSIDGFWREVDLFWREGFWSEVAWPFGRASTFVGIRRFYIDLYEKKLARTG